MAARCSPAESALCSTCFLFFSYENYLFCHVSLIDLRVRGYLDLLIF
uniref:Uncharacterized protein n=1 Tax=Arundo donax TaxID=35708 RepID=A0A0A9GX45_ARUDO